VVFSLSENRVFNRNIKNLRQTHSIVTVSIITPLHNSEKFVEETISSVLRQSFKEWELIVIDDHSTDRGYDIVSSMAKADSRIKLYRQKPGRRGAAHARNLAIELASGRYIAFLDSDDIWHSDKLCKQIDYMESANIDFSYTDYGIINASGEASGRLINCPEKINKQDLLKSCPIGCLTVVYNQEVTGSISIPNLQRANDYALWLEIFKKIEFGYGIPEALADYRISNQSLSSKKFQKLFWLFKSYRLVLGKSILRSLYLTVRFVSVNIWKSRLFIKVS
jgi:teichuronic acid biosynthesis glycosyltransferase TuaG